MALLCLLGVLVRTAFSCWHLWRITWSKQAIFLYVFKNEFNSKYWDVDLLYTFRHLGYQTKKETMTTVFDDEFVFTKEWIFSFSANSQFSHGIKGLFIFVDFHPWPGSVQCGQKCWQHPWKLKLNYWPGHIFAHHNRSWDGFQHGKQFFECHRAKIHWREQVHRTGQWSTLQRLEL